MNEIKEKLDTIAQIGELVQLKLISETDGRIIINTLINDVMIKFLTTDVKKSLEIKPREDFETKDIDKSVVVTKIDRSFLSAEIKASLSKKGYALFTDVKFTGVTYHQPLKIEYYRVVSNEIYLMMINIDALLEQLIDIKENNSL